MNRLVHRLGLLVLAGFVLSAAACSGDRGDKDKGRAGPFRGQPQAFQKAWQLPHKDAPAGADAEAAAGILRTTQDAKTEEYRHRVDNPFHLAARIPLATLSTDVDTAGYTNLRKYLLDGVRPPADAVKVEEMINYFSYDHPQPRGDAPVSLSADLARCPWNERHLLVRIALRGKSLDRQQLPARNLVFLIDTSGSMSPANRLPLLKESLKLLVNGLSPQDRVALVTYAGSSELALDSTPGTEREKILAAIDALQAGGSTNGEGGIRLAYRIAQNHFIQGGLNRVILGTDGDFNVGVSSQAELIRLIEEKRRSGVYLTVLGFGMGNLKDSTLKRLAQHGNGHHAYIDTLDEARRLFVEQGAALVTIAKDVKLQVEFNPQRVGAYRLIGYEHRLLRDQDFKNDAVDAGELGSGHTMTALFEVVPAGTKINVPGIDPLRYQTSQPTEAAGSEWLTVKMRYKHPEKETSEEVATQLSGDPVALERVSDDFRFAASVAAFGMVLRDSPYRGEASFDLVANLATRSLGVDPHGRRAEFLGLVRKAQALPR